jgi:hypothetical protein
MGKSMTIISNFRKTFLKNGKGDAKNVDCIFKRGIGYISAVQVHDFVNQNQSQSKTFFPFAAFAPEKMLKEELFFFFGDNRTPVLKINDELISLI